MKYCEYGTRPLVAQWLNTRLILLRSRVQIQSVALGERETIQNINSFFVVMIVGYNVYHWAFKLKVLNISGVSLPYLL